MGWEGQKIIGHVGRFNEQKNHRFLVAVFAEIHRKDPQTRLVLVGKGELEPEIRELVREKGLEDAVDFLGVRSDAQTLYQGMDLLLFPSLFEGLSVGADRGPGLRPALPDQQYQLPGDGGDGPAVPHVPERIPGAVGGGGLAPFERGPGPDRQSGRPAPGRI